MTEASALLQKTVNLQRERHLGGLDGLRGVACLLVFIYHLRWAAGDPPLWFAGIDILRLMKNCDIGVAIFFALSGLLLSTPFWRTVRDGGDWPDLRVYLWRRICRIVPAYYACLVVVYLLESGTYTFFGFVDFTLHATFLHTWADFSYLSQYGVLWTIGIEFQFYLLLPLLMAMMRYISRRLGVAAACSLLILATFLLSEAMHGLLRALEPLTSDRVLSARGPVLEMGTIFHYLKYFALGISGSALMLSWRRQEATTAPLVAAVLGFAGIAMLIAFSGEGVWRETAVTGWPLGFACFALLAAALPVCPLFSRVFETRLLAFAGQISYGVYLWHDFVLKAVFGGTLPGRLHGGWLVGAGGVIALAVTTLIAWLSFRFIEQPAMRSSCPFVTVRVA